MKHFFCILLFIGACFLTGCFTPTQSTISFYDQSGKITKTVTASESIAKTVVSAYKDHSVIWYDNGWHISVKATMTTTENPFPTLDISGGKKDKATFILHKDHDINVLPGLVKVIRDSEIKFTIKDTSASILSGSSDVADPLNVVGKSLKTLAHPVYAWANGSTIVYTVSAEPKVGDQVVGKSLLSKDLKVVGAITAINDKAIVVAKTVYIRSEKDDQAPSEKVADKEATDAVVNKDILVPTTPVAPEALSEVVKEAISEEKK